MHTRVRQPSSLCEESGLTLVEMLVAAVLLVTGVLGTFALVDIADRSNSVTSSREGATNVVREVLEAAQATPYARIGTADWIKPRLASLPDGDGAVASPNASTNVTTVKRRGITYTVTTNWCSVDDGRDGYGAHAAGTSWCADSSAVAASDGQPEDFKRVGVRVTWTINKSEQSLFQTATFSASGAAVGPTVGSLTVTAPVVADQSAPLISANPTNGIVSFRAVSVGAGDMRFTVNGAEQESGVSAAGNGTWNFNWNVSALKDGVYTIGAIGIDGLGTRGDPRTIQVTLNRGAPAAIANLTGGYNYVTIGGKRTLILEGTWDANTEGNIIGYEVMRGTTVVCPTSLETSCADLTPPVSGTSTYSFRTWYRDGAGAARFITTAFTVPAPTFTSIATQYHLTWDSASPSGIHTGSACRGGSGAGAKFDMRSSAASFTARTSGTGWVSGCLPPLPAGVAMSAGSMSLSSRWINAGASDCSSLPVYLYLNGTTLVAGTGVNGGGSLPRIPRNTTTTAPSTSTTTFATSARTLAEGDQLSFHTPAATFSSACAGVSMYFNSSAQPVSLTLPLTGGGTANLSHPAPVTGLAAAPSGDGGTTLTWQAPGGTPAPDFYRIYRDGREYADRYDTAGDTGDATISWTDAQTGGTEHTYYVTTASPNLVESALVGPVSG